MIWGRRTAASRGNTWGHAVLMVFLSPVGWLGCGSLRPPPGKPSALENARNARDPKARHLRTLTVDATRCDARGKRNDQTDLNHDELADLISIREAEDHAGGRVLCRQADLNFDGRLDAYLYYGPDEVVVREQFDLDFDGHIDLGRHYRDGQIVVDELDTNHDRVVDVWRRYQKGRLVRLDRDRDADGRPDMFSFFVGEQLDRIGYDTNGDGRVDQWDHDAARRVRLAASHRQPEAGARPSTGVEYVDEPGSTSRATPSGSGSGSIPEPSRPETGAARASGGPRAVRPGPRPAPAREPQPKATRPRPPAPPSPPSTSSESR